MFRGESAASIAHFRLSDQIFAHAMHDSMVSSAGGEPVVRGMMGKLRRRD
jgi:hypothetical protein